MEINGKYKININKELERLGEVDGIHLRVFPQNGLQQK